ncbi:MAG: hypothetical protein AAF074_02970 [Pseudomonadota bacterium]
MVDFTDPSGGKVTIDAQKVIRARRALSSENPSAGSRIDHGVMQLVREPIDAVAAAIAAENAAFTKVTTRDGSAVWFDARKVKGPLRISPGMSAYGYRSSLTLMGYRQHVTETHQEVADIIRKAGGKPEPVPH